MKKVSFTEMKNGTKEDYLFLDKHEKDFASKTADRILKFMSGLNETLGVIRYQGLSTHFKVLRELIEMVKVRRWL